MLGTHSPFMIENHPVSEAAFNVYIFFSLCDALWPIWVITIKHALFSRTMDELDNVSPYLMLQGHLGTLQLDHFLLNLFQSSL